MTIPANVFRMTILFVSLKPRFRSLTKQVYAPLGSFSIQLRRDAPLVDQGPSHLSIRKRVNPAWLACTVRRLARSFVLHAHLESLIRIWGKALVAIVHCRIGVLLPSQNVILVQQARFHSIKKLGIRPSMQARHV